MQFLFIESRGAQRALSPPAAARRGVGAVGVCHDSLLLDVAKRGGAFEDSCGTRGARGVAPVVQHPVDVPDCALDLRHGGQGCTGPLGELGRVERVQDALECGWRGLEVAGEL